MTHTLEKRLTPEQYLEAERASEVRHEFVDGVMVAMAGSTRTHNEIVFNVRAALTAKARELGCAIASESLQVITKGARYRYPDIVVGCAPGTNELVIEAPCFIAEIQSDSTAETDHGAKLEEYTNLPSLQRYAIVSQKTRQVVLYKRQSDMWTFVVLSSSGEIDIPCLETSLTLDAIYAGLELT
jgi:Uma2 family endonuclease